jgi:hypothetical protein
MYLLTQYLILINDDVRLKSASTYHEFLCYAIQAISMLPSNRSIATQLFTGLQ